MQRLICLLFPAFFFAPYWADAYESLRTASITQTFGIESSDPEVVGGPTHPCYRECVTGEVKTCFYKFALIQYATMSGICGNCPIIRSDCYASGCITAGGDIRSLVTVNHMLPGPSIQVCEGDNVQVTVKNTLPSDSATIHWHGIHQIDTPYMDGVPFVTQCPILPFTSYKYNFTASPSGTHMYHSHSGYQEMDGLYGSFIVRPASDPLAAYYDHDLPEHVAVVWHWFSSNTDSTLITGGNRDIDVMGYSFTINGLASTLAYEVDGVSYYTPREVFYVERGFRYRFRMIANTAVYCPIQVSVDNHKAVVIAADGASVSPVTVDTFIINAGERYDFVLNANQRVSSYWIRLRGFGNCASVSGEAILRYVGAEESDPPEALGYDEADRAGVLLNPVNETLVDYSNNTLIRITELKSTATTDRDDISGTSDSVVYIPFDYKAYNEFFISGFHPQFINITFETPTIPLLTQRDEITPDMYCTANNDSAKDCSGTYCVCPIIYPLPAYSLVELVIIDETIDIVDDHPIHIHGQYVHVVAAGIINGSSSLDEVKRRNEAGEISKNLHDAPLRDTILVPARGYAVLRFYTKNPGYWLFHCHVGNHMESGMRLVFKIGEHSEMRDTPKDFPTCGNYDITKKRTVPLGTSN